MKIRFYIALIFTLCAICTVSAADTAKTSGPALLQKEIQAAQDKLLQADINTQDKHDAYTKLGRLLQLSGDIEKSGEAWEKAAFAIPEKRDDTALLESAACAMAMGDWNKAGSSVKLVLLTGRGDKQIFSRAKYLDAQIEAFKTGNYVILNSFTDDPEYTQVRPQIYYTLWKLSGDKEYKVKLINEYPESPETRALLVDSGALGVIQSSPAAYWMLFPGRENIHLEKMTTSSASAPPGDLENAPIPALQTGLYTYEKNAKVQAKKLTDAGFTANMVKRIVSGSTYWAVTVPSGANVNQTINKLKNAGFEAVPIS